MDLNGDNNIDLLVAGFGGFAKVFYGKNDGTFSEGAFLCDKSGKKINRGMYWSYNPSMWTTFAKDKIRKGGLSEEEISKLKLIGQASDNMSLVKAVCIFRAMWFFINFGE